MKEQQKPKGPIPNVVPGPHPLGDTGLTLGDFVESEEFPLDLDRLAAALRPYRNYPGVREELLGLGARPSRGGEWAD